ncbi:MAG: hypothetical protein FWD97_00425 [Defluviitaleaceae bacterium]|nr:hypothetical protein [Defluviitaleaceae bacterium]
MSKANSITPPQIFKQTLPFTWVKLGLRLLFVIYVVILLVLIANGITSMSEATNLWSDFRILSDWNVWLDVGRHAIWGFVLIIVTLPPLAFILKKYLRYMVQVGHIATIVKIVSEDITPTTVPPITDTTHNQSITTNTTSTKAVDVLHTTSLNQLTYGITQAKNKFATANLFFVADKVVHQAVVALRPVVQRTTSGLGVLSLPARMFTSKLIRYIDECCLAYVFLRPNLSLPESIKLVVASYARGGKAMTRQAVLATMHSLMVSLGFYAIGAMLLWNGVSVLSAGVPYGIFTDGIIRIIFATFFILVVGVFKKCVLDSYVMTVMVATFIKEAIKSRS